MEKIICRLTQIPMRIEPNHRSEQISQMIFGETATVVDQVQGWYKIVMDFDTCTGWIESDSVENCSSDYPRTNKLIIKEPVVQLNHENTRLFLCAGSEIEFPDARGCVTIHNKEFRFSEPVASKDDSILTDAGKYLHAPYQWGGRTVFGIDCSGFIQILFKIHGLRLPRNSKDQVKRGNEVKSFGAKLPGDLAFFENEEGNIIHVGLYMGNDQIVHASKRVRIDTLDETGIYSNELKRYTHKLSCIRRMI
jgi:hypothetical protein